MEPNRDCRTSQTRIRKRPAAFITHDRAESQAAPVQHADEEGTCKKKGRDEQNDEKCHRLAALLTHMASTEISAIQVNAKGLGFNALLKYIGNTLQVRGPFALSLIKFSSQIYLGGSSGLATKHRSGGKSLRRRSTEHAFTQSKNRNQRSFY